MAQETRFTPGPWCTPHFAKPEVNCQCRYVLSENQGGFGAIASVHCSGDGDDWQSNGDNPKFEESVANAHLIAAAPEMYEALEGIKEWINRLPIPTHGATKKMMDISAALSKARGEL